MSVYHLADFPMSVSHEFSSFGRFFQSVCPMSMTPKILQTVQISVSHGCEKDDENDGDNDDDNNDDDNDDDNDNDNNDGGEWPKAT